MKKIFLAFMAVGFLTLTSCEGFFQSIVESFLGSASVTVSDENGSHQTDFSCCVGNTMLREVDSTVSTLFIAASIDLTAQNAMVTFPYLGINVADSALGDYQLDEFPLMFFTAPTLSPDGLLTELRDKNVVVFVANDSTWYLSNGGTATITSYPAVGGEIKGSYAVSSLIEVSESTLVNAVAWITNYSTNRTAELIAEGMTDEEEIASTIEAEVNAMPLSEFFPSCSASGSFSGLRLSQNITNLLGAK